MSVGSSSSTPAVAGYEWDKDNVLKYKSCLSLIASVTALQRQVKLAKPEDSCKLVVQTCGSDDFPFSREAHSLHPSF